MATRRKGLRDELIELIKQVCLNDAEGVRALEGIVPEPDWVELIEMLRGTPEKLPVQVSKGLTEAERLVFLKEKIEAILSSCGGWGSIVEAAKLYRCKCPEDWELFVSYCHVKTSPYRIQTVEDLARDLHMGKSTLIKRKEIVPSCIVHLAFTGQVKRERGKGVEETQTYSKTTPLC